MVNEANTITNLVFKTDQCGSSPNFIEQIHVECHISCTDAIKLRICSDIGSGY